MFRGLIEHAYALCAAGNFRQNRYDKGSVAQVRAQNVLRVCALGEVCPWSGEEYLREQPAAFCVRGS